MSLAHRAVLVNGVLLFFAACATPVERAAKAGRLDKVERLLKQGASAEEAFAAAVTEGHVELADRLVAQGVNLDRCWHKASFSTIALALYGKRPVDMARLVISRGAKAPTDCGTGPLMALAVNDRRRLQEGEILELAKILLAAGADPNKVDRFGEGLYSFTATPLVMAANRGNLKLVELFLAHGADPGAAFSTGRSAIEAAREAGHHPIAALLERELKRKAAVTAAPAVSAGPLRHSKQPDLIEAEPSTPAPELAPRYAGSARPDDFAVVVGITNYADLPEARFARRDAQAVAEHLQAMGIPRRNMALLMDAKASRSAMDKYLEAWLPKNVRPDSRVFVYFSGHGAPDPENGQAYLVPHDGDPSFLQNTAYPLKRLYESLSKLRAKEVIVVLDACFSGAGGRSVLAKGARPLVMKTDETLPRGSIALLTAAAGTQITSTLEEKGHGVFTYFLLSGLNGEARDAQGRITARSLYDYLKPKVEDEARRQNRDQTPVLHGAEVVLRAGF